MAVCEAISIAVLIMNRLKYLLCMTSTGVFVPFMDYRLKPYDSLADVLVWLVWLESHLFFVGVISHPGILN